MSVCVHVSIARMLKFTIYHLNVCIWLRKPVEVAVPKATVTSHPPAPPVSSPSLATEGLARVGARAALSFAFAFLRRAWRLGEDNDLCEQVICITSSYLRIQTCV